MPEAEMMAGLKGFGDGKAGFGLVRELDEW